MRYFFYCYLALFLIMIMVIQTPGQQREKLEQAFAIGPTMVNIDARPGQTIESKFNIVTENTSQPTRYNIRIFDVGQDESGGTLPVAIGEGARSAADWISVNSDITVPPNGRMEVPFKVAVPSNAHGAYFLFLNVQLSPERPKAKMGAGVRPSISFMVSVYTRSRAPLHVDLKELFIARGSSNNPGELVLRVKNTGTWKTTVEGDILLYPDKGTFPVRVPIHYSRGGTPVEIYPGLEITLRCPLDDIPPAGDYKVASRLILNGKYQSVSHLELNIPPSIGRKSVKGRLLSKSESDLNVTVTPNLAEVNIMPGAMRVIPIRIQNRDERTAIVKADLAEVKMEANGQLVFSAEASEGNDWITLSPETLEVPPKRTSVVKAKIEVPRESSGLSAILKAIRLNVTAPSTDEEWESASEFGVLLVASDPKSPPPTLEISNFELVRAGPNTNPATAIVHIQNSGEKVARLKGKIALERATGQSIAHMAIGIKQEEYILPGASRIFRMALPAVDEGEFRVFADFTPVAKNAQSVSKEEFFTSTAEMPAGL